MLKILLIALILIAESLAINPMPNDDHIDISHYENPKKSDYHKKPYKDYNEKKEYYENKKHKDEYKGQKKQKQKEDYYEAKKHEKFLKHNGDHLNFIDSNDNTKYHDNEWKQGNNFDKQRKPAHHHDKMYFDKSEVRHLESDLDVNYKGHKEINPEAEFINVPATQNTKESYQVNWQNPEGDFKRSKKYFYDNLKQVDLSSPPPANNTVLMARFIVHNVDWVAVATLSSHTSSKNVPFVTIKSMSDGPVDNGIGIPFFYLTPMDLSTQDLAKDNRASITMTLAETPYCQQQSLDPEDPRCARLIMVGKIKRIKPGTQEEDIARQALFTRHGSMESWPKDHEWFFAKLKIGQIILLDRFGGPSSIDVEQYLNAENSPK